MTSRSSTSAVAIGIMALSSAQHQFTMTVTHASIFTVTGATMTNISAEGVESLMVMDRSLMMGWAALTEFNDRKITKLVLEFEDDKGQKYSLEPQGEKWIEGIEEAIEVFTMEPSMSVRNRPRLRSIVGARFGLKLFASNDPKGVIYILRKIEWRS